MSTPPARGLMRVIRTCLSSSLANRRWRADQTRSRARAERRAMLGKAALPQRWIDLRTSLAAALLLVAGCQSKPPLVSLMPTPVFYTELGIGPLDDVPDSEKWAPRQVFYVTTRKRAPDYQRIEYGNREGTSRMGAMLIGFGTEDLEWDELRELSADSDRAGRKVPLTIAGIVEMGRWDLDAGADANTLSIPLAMINNAIAEARDDDLFIYIHGAKVNFYNAGAFAAELDHFTRRDMTALAFAWPTHQNILSYVLGQDVRRAQRSASALTDLLELLAAHSQARNIHLVSWSAGGRLVTAALDELHARHAGLTREQWAQQFRIGTVYYAASDLPRSHFFNSLDALENIAERVIVSVTDNDGALRSARLFMGGGYRLGDRRGDLAPAELERLKAARNLEVIDVSMGAHERGFDIDGHRYWFDHPWASTDVLLSLRSDLLPAERGLEQAGVGFLWYMPPDYPQRLRESMLRPELQIRRPGSAAPAAESATSSQR